jgi:hypothetical protein
MAAFTSAPRAGFGPSERVRIIGNETTKALQVM